MKMNGSMTIIVQQGFATDNVTNSMGVDKFFKFRIFARQVRKQLAENIGRVSEREKIARLTS
jgi:hypothetical protein